MKARALACITLREIELRGSHLDTFVAEGQCYLGVHFVILRSLVVIVILLGPGRHFFFRIGQSMAIVHFLTANHQP